MLPAELEGLGLVAVPSAGWLWQPGAPPAWRVRLRDGSLEGVLRHVATGKVARLGTPYFRAHVLVPGAEGEEVVGVYGSLREAGQALRELLEHLEAARDASRRLDAGGQR